MLVLSIVVVVLRVGRVRSKRRRERYLGQHHGGVVTARHEQRLGVLRTLLRPNLGNLGLCGRGAAVTHRGWRRRGAWSWWVTESIILLFMITDWEQIETTALH